MEEEMKSVNPSNVDSIQELRERISYDHKTYEKRLQSIFKNMTITACSLFFVLLLLLFLFPESFSDEKYVERTPLINKITILIRNGASLELIKHAYEVRNLVVLNPFAKKEKAEYYEENVPLSAVLKDISIIYYSSEPWEEDTLFYNNLCNIIQENQYHNPFDNLEESQITFFENVRIKAGEHYDSIQDDVVRIASEMSNKNQLVTTYLNRSTTSFRISIVALVITIILSIIQIVMGIKTNRRIDQVIQTDCSDIEK